MPKPLTESEREYIKNRLLEEATYCLERYGVRKTTVDEIVRRAGIPKGTFYLFYDSKELLLFDVFMGLHDVYQKKLMAEIMALSENLTPESLTDTVFGIYKTMENSFMLRLMTSGELELLFRKLPPEVSQIHAARDDFQVEALIALVPQISAEKVGIFSAALRGIFISMLYRQEIGGDVFDEALRVMIRGVVIQMFEGEKK